MKTIISLFIISTSVTCYSQNMFMNNVAVQQQNYLNNDNVQENNFSPAAPKVQQVRQVRNKNRGNRSNFNQQQVNPTSNINSNVNPNDQAGQVFNNVGEILQVPVNKQEQNKEVNEEKESTQVAINLTINLPKIQLNRTKKKEEKVEPKRLEDYRIKTGNGNSTGSSSHKTKRNKHSFSRKIVKPIKCWWGKHFNRNVKFKFSCECFKF